MKRDMMAKALMIGFIVTVFLCVSSPVLAGEGVIKLKYANFFPPVHKQSVLAEQWCQEVEKRTQGRIKIMYLPGGTLVPPNQAYEAAVRGIADISMTVQQWTAGRFPLTGVLYLPLGVKNGYQATKLINAWYEEFKPKEYDDVKVIYQHAAGSGLFLTLKPVDSIDGLVGMKIRAAGETMKVASAMGSIPVSVPVSDLYDGLKRGVIEGLLFPPECLKGWRLADLIRGMQKNPGIGYASTLVVVMNKKMWNSLPADIQKIIDEINKEWIEKTGKAWEELDNEGIEYGLSKGLKVVEISKEGVSKTKEKMKPLYDAYLQNMKEKGLPGEECVKFCLNWLRNNP